MDERLGFYNQLVLLLRLNAVLEYLRDLYVINEHTCSISHSYGNIDILIVINILSDVDVKLVGQITPDILALRRLWVFNLAERADNCSNQI